ncbi:L-serine ammonia-lyase [Thalassospiraceae bacterium LMO-SO8]|nr:L-serine ammonia-lyase [Alphaproteobacteria bacterium LMO-S08]WND77179.1 L-serine ammonia-lyase [Thalassospiraceae bacterium LMO-SO8]
MFLSVFDIFKVGIGPSSSHTVGPMLAAARFVRRMERQETLMTVTAVRATLYGSLAFTGKGHATDRAVILGLMGETPDAVDPDAVADLIARVTETKRLKLGGGPEIDFDPARDIVFDYGPALPGHANGMIMAAWMGGGDSTQEGDRPPDKERAYYSIGGGFIATDDEFAAATETADVAGSEPDSVPYPFATAAEMLDMGKAAGLSVAAMKRANELTRMSASDLDAGLDRIWAAMNACIERGVTQEGVLPGGLKVKRRAKAIWDGLQADKKRNFRLEHTVMDWISVYALAVNEENAGGGRVVTAPTNGAAGIVPAVGRYYLDFCPDASMAGIRDYLLTAAGIGGIIKANASISGAEVGCQGEVGSASAMAAAGLAAILGGTNAQIENAAEIAMEHHLGMTCDPVGGLVQVPCIERNAMGAVKAINAASLALKGDGTHFVPLDAAIETMRQTGADMHSKYKETSEGGLAVNLTAC